MRRNDDPAGADAAGTTRSGTTPGSALSPEPAASRLTGLALELAQAVARGDVSREQADAFLARLSPRAITR